MLSFLPAAGRWLWLLLAGLGLFLLLPAGLLPLAETTEARYAEIAREMVVSGNYLEPFFNGIKHFHKPPLAYWLIAAGLKLFGINDFGARFFGIFAALVATAYVFRLALIASGEQSTARRATLFFASSILFLAVSRIAATDIYLTCCTAAVLYHLLSRRYGDQRRRHPLLAGLWLGLGFLAKGPVIFLFTLLPFVIAKYRDPGHRRLFTWKETGLGILIFSAVALPWYLLVIGKNPELLNYFLKVQTADRILTNRFNRAQPFWYFIPILLGGFLPWSYFFCNGVAQLKRLPPRTRTIFAYVLVPFIFFSLNRSKLAPYLLPLFPAAALFTAEVCRHLPLPGTRRLTFWTLALLLAGLGLAGFFFPPLHSGRYLLLSAALLTGLCLYPLHRHRQEETFFLWGSCVLLLFSLSAHGAVILAASEFKAYEAMTAAINQRDPDRKLEVLVYQDFLPSISFYRNRLAVMALGRDRETLFQDDDAFRQTTLDSGTAVKTFLTDRKEIFVVAKANALRNFQDLYPSSCEELFRQRRQGAYLCRLTPSTNLPPPTAKLTPRPR